ncbi:MAG: hypothetical protein AAFQ94_31085, partial [Bacteroidota bacterium]
MKTKLRLEPILLIMILIAPITSVLGQRNEYVNYDLSWWFSRNGTVSLDGMKITVTRANNSTVTYNLPNGSNSNNTRFIRGITGGTPKSIRVHGRVATTSANGAISINENIDILFTEANGRLDTRCGGRVRISGGAGSIFPNGPALSINLGVFPTLLTIPSATLTNTPPGNYCTRDELTFNYVNMPTLGDFEVEIGEIVNGNFVDRTVNEQIFERKGGDPENGSFSFSLEDILGSNYIYNLNKNYRFRFKTSSNNICGTMPSGQFNTPGSLPTQVTGNYRFFPDPPSIQNYFPNRPTCPDDEGSFTIIHGSDTPPSTTFKYTITQLVYSETGNCDDNPNLPNNINSRTYSQITQGANSSNIFTTTFQPNDRFCTGFIGNFTETLSPFSTSLRTVTINSGLSVTRDGGNTNELILYPGIYEIKIESDTRSACFDTFFFEISESSYQDLIYSSSVQDNTPSCAGIAEGAINITLDRGRGTLNWTLTGGPTPITGSTTSRVISTPNSLEHGINYSLSVTDQCESYPNLRTVSLTNDGPELNPVISKIDPSCIDSGGGNGSVTVTAPSGVAGKNYTYTLFNSANSQIGSSVNVGTTNRTHTFNNLDATEYYVRASAPGCDNDNSSPQTLAAPASFSSSSITRGTITPVACATGGNDGSVVISNISKAADDDISLQYTISGGGLSSPRTGTINRSDLSSGAYTISGLPSGNGYSISLIDLCKGNEPVALSNPDNFNISRPQPIDLADITNKTVACFETPTTIDINISEGTAPFVVNVFRKNTATGLFDQPAFFTDNSVQRSELPLQVAGLAVGDYRVEVTSGSPCTADDDFDEFTISAGNATAALSATITKRVNTKNGLNLDCNADNTGQLTVVVSGGV